MVRHLEFLEEMTNNTFIGPEKIIMCHNQVVGYTYPYVKASTLAKISPSTKVKNLFPAIEKLIQDADDVSKKSLDIGDLHDKNILFQNMFSIIDLDDGKKSIYDENKTIIFNRNLVLKVLINSLFKIESRQDMQIHSLEIQKLYTQIFVESYQKIYDFFESFVQTLEKPDLTIKDLRRTRLITKTYNSYYQPF